MPWLGEHTVERIDDQRYALRFTPRRPSSNWSSKNRDIAGRDMLEEGLMTPRRYRRAPP